MVNLTLKCRRHKLSPQGTERSNGITVVLLKLDQFTRKQGEHFYVFSKLEFLRSVGSEV